MSNHTSQIGFNEQYYDFEFDLNNNTIEENINKIYEQIKPIVEQRFNL